MPAPTPAATTAAKASIATAPDVNVVPCNRCAMRRCRVPASHGVVFPTDAASGSGSGGSGGGDRSCSGCARELVLQLQRTCDGALVTQRQRGEGVNQHLPVLHGHDAGGVAGWHGGRAACRRTNADANDRRGAARHAAGGAVQTEGQGARRGARRVGRRLPGRWGGGRPVGQRRRAGHHPRQRVARRAVWRRGAIGAQQRRSQRRRRRWW